MTHPSTEELEAFGSGLIDDADFGRIREHIADCAECRNRMRSFPPDAFTQLLRDSVNEEDPL